MDPEVIRCGKCGNVYRWRAEFAGRNARCKCGAVVEFPPAEALEPIDLSTGELDLTDEPAVPSARTAPASQAFAAGNLDLSDDADPAPAPTGNAPPPVSPLAELAATRESHRPSDELPIRSNSRRVISERGHADDDDDIVKTPPKPWWKRAAAAGLGITVAIVVLVFLRSVGSSNRLTLPESAGKQTRSYNGVEFASFDDQSDLDLLQLTSHSRVDIGQSAYAVAKGDFKLIEARVQNHWVFMWHDIDENHGVQGLINRVNVSYIDYRGARTTGDYWTQHISGTDAKGVDDLLSQGFESQHTFGAATRGHVYVATVRHPVDEASLQRARAFLAEAIKRPRAVHHASGVLAIMRAAGETDETRLAWVRRLATTDDDTLSRETQPDADDYVRPAITETCRRARTEAAITLAMITGFAEVDPLIACLDDRYDRAAVSMTMLMNLIERVEFDDATFARFKTMVAKLKSGQAHSLARLIGERESLKAFAAFLAAPATQKEDPLVADMIKFIRFDRPHSPKVLRLKPLLTEALAKEPSDSPRLMLLFELLQQLDEDAYLTQAMTRLEKAPVPWPTWAQELLVQIHRRSSGHGGSRFPQADWNALVLRHVDRFEGLARALPQSMHETKNKISQVVGRVDRERGRSILDRANSDNQTYTAAQGRSSTQMRYMIYARDTQGLTQVLRDGGKPQGKMPGNVEPPLIAAARVGDVEVIRMLLAAGADPLVAWKPSTTLSEPTVIPIDVALLHGHVEAAGVLVDAMLKSPQKSTTDITHYQLLAAIRDGNLDQVRKLVPSITNQARVPVYAVLLGNEPVITLVLDHNKSFTHAYTGDLFYAAITHRKQDRLNDLLQRGLDPHRHASLIKLPGGKPSVNAMDAAILAENFEAMAVLFEKKAAPMYLGLTQRNASLANQIFAKAIWFNRLGAAQWALDHGADIRFANDANTEPLTLARNANGPSFLWLIERGVTKSRYFSSPPWAPRLAAGGEVAALAREVPPFAEYLAMHPSNLDRLKALLDSGFDVNQPVRAGIKGQEPTLLFTAALHNNEPAVRLLIERGADVNARGPGTPAATSATVLEISFKAHPGSIVNQILHKAGAKYPQE